MAEPTTKSKSQRAKAAASKAGQSEPTSTKVTAPAKTTKTAKARTGASSTQSNGKEAVSSPKPIEPIALPQPLHLVCKQTTLNDALSFVKLALPSKPLHPVLTNVLIKAEAGLVSVTVSDMSLTLQATFEAQVDQPGTIALPLEVFASVVSKCPVGDVVLSSAASLEAESGLSVNNAEEPAVRYFTTVQDAQQGTTQIRGMDAAEFPVIQSSRPHLSLPSKVGRTALKAVAFAISTDEQKRILTGVQWQLLEEQLRCIASDGSQIAFISLSTAGVGKKPRRTRKATDEVSCVVPHKAVKELIRTLDKVDVEESLWVGYDSTASHITFEVADEGITKQFVCRCLEGEYPNIRAALSHYDYPSSVACEKPELLARLDRLSALADKDSNAVVLEFKPQQQVIELSIEQDYGKSHQVVSAAMPEDLALLSIKFNVRYLLDAVKAIASSAIELRIDQPFTPVCLVPSGNLDLAEVSMQAEYFVLPLYDAKEAAKALQQYTQSKKQSSSQNK